MRGWSVKSKLYCFNLTGATWSGPQTALRASPFPRSYNLFADFPLIPTLFYQLKHVRLLTEKYRIHLYIRWSIWWFYISALTIKKGNARVLPGCCRVGLYVCAFVFWNEIWNGMICQHSGLMKKLEKKGGGDISDGLVLKYVIERLQKSVLVQASA